MCLTCMYYIRSFEGFEARYFMPAVAPPIGNDVPGYFSSMDDNDGATQTCTPSEYTGK